MSGEEDIDPAEVLGELFRTLEPSDIVLMEERLRALLLSVVNELEPAKLSVLNAKLDQLFMDARERWLADPPPPGEPMDDAAWRRLREGVERRLTGDNDA